MTRRLPKRPARGREQEAQAETLPPKPAPVVREEAPPERTAPRTRHQPAGLRILHEDRDILVVDKAPGLLTVGTETQREQTAYYRLTNYVRKGNAKSPQRVFIVHRLDREVSGLLVFAKSNAAKLVLQSQWESAEKRYAAVVHGIFSEKEGTLSSYLIENSAHVVHATNDRKNGKLSHTGYRVLKESRDHSLLEVTLLTGRKHQIRVHLADAGHPIIGDKKYGSRSRGGQRMALHAMYLAFNHPYSGKRVVFETPVPGYFERLIGSGLTGR